MKPECPIDWKTAFTAALLGFLGAYLIGGYLNMPDGGPEDCPPAAIGCGAYPLSHIAQKIIA